MNGARHVLKWEELYRTMTAEHILLYAVAETHLSELEEPPIHADWRWEGKNRAGHGRKGGGVGFLWRREQKWQREDRGCADHLWMTGDLMGIPVAVCVVYLAVNGVHYEENERLLECGSQPKEGSKGERHTCFASYIKSNSAGKRIWCYWGLR
ncbi:hypothetical protein HPB52_004403 [Rhipicephalus sanguineus]|uniref:Uncharacterized protein n=1 Tax=Rhipicephalus sanguineus TaxID=34632 RepID=A0A9D4Q784_RHISA|nr:hypothetical protein HPB52_004403 [Rhipicephalus sanguineus]